MIVLNYPNNPTGKILPTNVQDEIIDLAKKNDLYVLSDEIYAQYSYKEWKSLLSYNYNKSIVTQSFSKSHAMTGFRIGYAIANIEIINKMSKLQALCLTNVSALDADISKNTNIVKSRLKLLINRAKEIGLDFVEPDGAMYLFAKVPKDGFDSGKFANSLLEQGLAVAPGVGFGDFKDFIRISACTDEILSRNIKG
jgi:aspartate aminotransferase